MRLSLIVAASENHVIGIKNRLPWHLPNDLQYFRSRTMGKPIIMGRKTFDSLKRPLPGRTNIVITRNPEWHHEGVKVVHSIEEAIKVAEAITFLDGADEAMIIGGETLYTACLDQVDQIYLTRVEHIVEGDAFFQMPETGWQLIEDSPQESGGWRYSYQVYQRI